MSNKLYKVKIETDIMVFANSEFDAIEIAKKNAVNEVGVYGKGSAQSIKKPSDIPEDWKSVIPYSKDGTHETRKCIDIASKETNDEDIEEIIKIKNTAIVTPNIPTEEIKPETRPDPKPKELDWHETKSGRTMPSLRFVR